MNSSDPTTPSPREGFFVLPIILLTPCLVIYFMVWIVIAIEADYPSVRVDYASLSSFKVSNTTKLTAEWNIKLLLSNPNGHLRISYHHDAFHGKIFYRNQQGRPDNDIILETSTLQSFFNGNNMVQIKLNVDTYVGSYMAEKIDLSRRNHGMVEFGLIVSTSMRFKSDFFVFSGSKSSNVCYPLRFEISQNVYNTTPGILLQGVTCDLVYDYV